MNATQIIVAVTAILLIAAGDYGPQAWRTIDAWCQKQCDQDEEAFCGCLSTLLAFLFGIAVLTAVILTRPSKP